MSINYVLREENGEGRGKKELVFKNGPYKSIVIKAA